MPVSQSLSVSKKLALEISDFSNKMMLVQKTGMGRTFAKTSVGVNTSGACSGGCGAGRGQHRHDMSHFLWEVTVSLNKIAST